MESSIVKHFEAFIEVSEKLRHELESRTRCVTFKKGDLVIESEKVCTTSYFIVSGLLRIYYLKNGKEVSEYFAAENDWGNSPRSWRKGAIDIYNVDAIEDTEAIALDVKDMKFLFDHFPEMDKYGRLSMANVLDHLMNRIDSFRFTSAEEKYAHFHETYANVHHRIPLGMVASYLGISQETLSRLRSKK